MATVEEVMAFVQGAGDRSLPEMTSKAAARLRPFDLEPLRTAGDRRAAMLATAFCDAALAMRAVRLASLQASTPLKGETADARLNEFDVAVAMAAVAARAVDILDRAPPGVAPDDLAAAFAECDCWPI